MELDFTTYIQSAPNDNYAKFFQKLASHTTKPITEWSYNELLGYIVSRFFEHTKQTYVFKYNKQAPSSCYESFLVKTLMARVSSDFKILKSYIDWVVETRIGNKKIRTLAIFIEEKNTTDFTFKFLANNISNKINRTDVLPLHIINSINNPNIKTYGDIAFVYASNPNSDMFKNLTEEDMKDIKRVI